MRGLVVGIDGGIGAALVGALQRRGDSVFGTTRRPAAHALATIALDLSGDDVETAALPAVEIAFFCAAMTGLADCRKDPERARAVNTTGPARLARRLVAQGARVIFLSTNAVYDWQSPCVPASQPPCPLTVYGELKAEAEAEFSALGDAATILRLSKVLTPELKLFRGWIETLASGREVTAFADLHLAPIRLDDAVLALLALAESPESGLFQVSGAKDVSYVEAARHLARRLGVASASVHEGLAADAGFPREEITTFSSLDSSRYTRLTGWTPPDPYAVLDDVFGPALAAARSTSEITA